MCLSAAKFGHSVTLRHVSEFGTPPGAFGQAVVVTFTAVNAVLIVGNLIPLPGRRSRHATDGWVLWTHICDGYVLLRGVPTESGASGDYGTLGLEGFHKLGSFSGIGEH